jgi:hypothetical protein
MARAKVTTVKFGSITLEGLMLPDGSFAISVSQCSELFQFDKNQASRDLKRILGADFQFDKIASELHPKAVNYITLLQFEKLIILLSAKGNKIALELNLALVGLSLKQVFCDAFGIKFDAEDRQNYLKARMAGIKTRRTLTDEVKDWLKENEITIQHKQTYYYSTVSDMCNEAVLGMVAKEIRIQRNIPEQSKVRDHLTDAELKSIDRIEGTTMRLMIKKKLNPIEAMQQAIEFEL